MNGFCVRCATLSEVRKELVQGPNLTLDRCGLMEREDRLNKPPEPAKVTKRFGG